MLGWNPNGFHKKHAGTRYAERVFLHQLGSAVHVVHSGASGHETSIHYFSCSGGTSTDSKKTSGDFTSNLCFYIQWDMQVTYCIPVRPGHKTSTEYFSCSRGTSNDSTKSALGHVMPNVSFCIRWDLRLTECIPVRPGRETSMDFFLHSGGLSVVSIKSSPGHVTPNLCFCH
jgi:hypothetical protein